MKPKQRPPIYWGESQVISMGGLSLIVADACDHAEPDAFNVWIGERFEHSGKQWEIMNVVLLPFPFVLQGMPVALTVFQVR